MKRKARSIRARVTGWPMIDDPSTSPERKPRLEQEASAVRRDVFMLPIRTSHGRTLMAPH
jgi:hypothetical protein